MRMSKKLLKKLMPMLLSFVLIFAMCGNYVSAEEYEDDVYQDEYSDDVPEDSGEDTPEDEPEEEKFYTLTVELVSAEDDSNLSGKVKVENDSDTFEKTIENGKVDFEDMPSGKYTAVITSVDEDYVRPDEKKEFSIDDEDKTITFKADKKPIEETPEEESKPEDNGDGGDPEPEQQPQDVDQGGGSDNGGQEAGPAEEQQSQDDQQSQDSQSTDEDDDFIKDLEKNEGGGSSDDGTVEPDPQPQEDDSEAPEEASTEEEKKINITIAAEGLEDSGLTATVNLMREGMEDPVYEGVLSEKSPTLTIEVSEADEPSLYITDPEVSGEKKDEYTWEKTDKYTLVFTHTEPEPQEERLVRVIAEINESIKVSEPITGVAVYSGTEYDFTLNEDNKWEYTIEGIPDEAKFDEVRGLTSIEGAKLPTCVPGSDENLITIIYEPEDPEPVKTKTITIKANIEKEIINKTGVKSVKGSLFYDGKEYPYTLKADAGWKCQINDFPEEANLKTDVDVEPNKLEKAEDPSVVIDNDNNIIEIVYRALPEQPKDYVVKAKFADDKEPNLSYVYLDLRFTDKDRTVKLRKSDGWKTTIQIPADASFKAIKDADIKGYESPKASENDKKDVLTLTYKADKQKKVYVKIKVYGGSKPNIKVGWEVKGTSKKGTVVLKNSEGYESYIEVEKADEDKVKFTYPEVSGYKKISSVDPVKYISTDKRTKVFVQKKWIGPALKSVTVTLYKNGSSEDKVTLTAAGGWADTIRGNFYYYDQSTGEKNSYSVKETYNGESLKDYDYKTEITGGFDSGFVITNTAVATVDVPVYKRWYSEKPLKFIDVVLKADGEIIDTATITEAKHDTGHDYWKYTGFKNLPKYNSKGKEIKYTVEEDVPKGFKAEYKTYNGGVVIKNYQIGANTETTTISAKTGDDNNLMIYLGAMLVGLVAIVFAGRRKRND